MFSRSIIDDCKWCFKGWGHTDDSRGVYFYDTGHIFATVSVTIENKFNKFLHQEEIENFDEKVATL
jgi:hypothetical protein